MCEITLNNKPNEDFYSRMIVKNTYIFLFKHKSASKVHFFKRKIFFSTILNRNSTVKNCTLLVQNPTMKRVEKDVDELYLREKKEKELIDFVLIDFVIMGSCHWQLTILGHFCPTDHLEPQGVQKEYTWMRVLWFELMGLFMLFFHFLFFCYFFLIFGS